MTCEYLVLILPVRQWAFRSARFAASTVFPFSFGTRQTGFRENLAPTVRGWLIVTVHLPVPEQAPVHPLNRERDDGEAAKATVFA